MTEFYSIVYIYDMFLIHSSVDGHLDCFHVLDIVSSDAMYITGNNIYPLVIEHDER